MMIGLFQREVAFACLVAVWLSSGAPLHAQTVDAFLDNGAVRIGVSRAYGGAITWLSTSGGWNLVNNADKGRQIQQSYYAGASRTATNQCPAWSPWSWNPIMVGDCEGNTSPVLVLTNLGSQLYVKAQPLLWDRRHVLSQSFIELWIGFHPTLPNVVVVDNLFTCFRDASDEWGGPVAQDQEIPACYFVSCLNSIQSYTGNTPWQNAALSVIPNVFIWTQFVPTEQWAACLNVSGFGVGIYSPDATRMNAGKFGAGVTCNPFDSSTMHIAPLVTKAFDSTSVYGYRSFLAVGQLSDIRAAFYQIHQNPGLAPMQTLLPAGAVWKYDDTGANLGTAWRATNYNDSSWHAGPAMLGFGDVNGLLPATLIASNRQITTYFRTAFVAPPGTNATNLNLRILQDDAAVVFLNGAEIWRDTNITSGAIAYNTLASVGLDGAAESTWLTTNLPPSLLQRGTNWLAVEVHQNSATSSDVSFDFELTAQLPALPTALAATRAAGNQLTLAWPATNGIFRLFTATNLTPPVTWLQATNAPVLSNNFWLAPISTAGSRQRFYRLQTP